MIITTLSGEEYITDRIFVDTHTIAFRTKIEGLVVLDTVEVLTIEG